jgi:peptidoglycan glycosyltransferase
MQMLMIADAVANGGRMMKPRFVKEVVSSDGNVVRTEESSTLREAMTPSEAASLRDLLSGVVAYGTATDLAGLPYNIAGKTGTAEYGNVDDNTAHSWFTGFSGTGQNDIAVCVLVEGGGNGLAPATTVAGYVFRNYFG